MKTFSILAAGAAVMALSACGQGGDARTGDAAAPAAPAAMDGPRPGLWRITTTSDMAGMPAIPPQEVCVTRARFEPPSPGGMGGASGVECSAAEFRREGDAMVTTSRCTMQGGITSDSTVRVSGDFSRNYTMVSTTRMSGAGATMPEATLTMQAERIGDCPAAAG